MSQSIDLPKSFQFKLKLLIKSVLLIDDLKGVFQHGLTWFKIRQDTRVASDQQPTQADDQPLPELAFEYTIVDGNQAMAQVQAWSQRADGVPVIFSGQRFAGAWAEHWQQADADGDTYEAVLARGESLDVSVWLQQQYLQRRDAREREQQEMIAMLGGEHEPDEALSRKMVGQVQGVTTLAVLTRRGAPAKDLVVGLVPVDPQRPWQVAAYFRYAGWHDSPQADVHVAMFKHWYEHYGAVVVAMTEDTVELRVSRRPASRDEATKLALQMYLFCPDCVEQGAETVGTLAEILMGSDYWFFWWD